MIVGRKSKLTAWLTDKKLEQLTAWAAEGMTERKISALMGVSERSFNRYKENDNFVSAIKKGRELWIEKQAAKVEESLDLISEIHWIEETEEKDIIDDKGNITGKVIRTVRKQVDPNVTALIFRAKKLMPAKYGDNPEDRKHGEAIEAWHNEIAEAIRGKQTDIDPLSVAFYALEAEGREKADEIEKFNKEMEKERL